MHKSSDPVDDMSARAKLKRDMPHLFGHQAVQAFLSRKRTRRGGALFPKSVIRGPGGKLEYWRSTDREVLSLTEWLLRFNDEFPVDTTDEGYAGPTAIPSSLNSILSVAAYAMDPVPLPVMDNAKLIAANGVSDRLLDVDRPYFEEVMRLCFEVATPTDLRLTKGATTAMPYFSKDTKYRVDAALKALNAPDEFLDLIVAGPRGAPELLRRFHALLMFTMFTRLQADGVTEDDGHFVPKPRIAPTDEEARSGDFDGGVPADKSVRDGEGNVIQNHFAMRARDVHGMNGVINYFLTGVLGCFRHIYLDRFGATFKVRGDDDKTARIRGWKYVVGSDVKTMDKMIPRWFFDWFCDRLALYVDERVARALRMACSATYLAANPWEDTPRDYNPMHGPDPFKEVADLCVGLASGIAANKEFGTVWMTCVYVCVLRAAGVLTHPSQIEQLLLGQHPMVALLDSSDDAVFLTNNLHLARLLRHPKSPYAVLEPEQPVKYLGSVFYRAHDNMLASAPNVCTYLINMLCREESVEWKNPQDWAIGVLARTRVYSAAPCFRDVNDLLDEGLRLHLGSNPLHLAKTLSSWVPSSYDDALVTLDPSVLHYKVDPADVSPDVLANAVATIPSGDFFPAIRHLFKVPIIA